MNTHLLKVEALLDALVELIAVHHGLHPAKEMPGVDFEGDEGLLSVDEHLQQRVVMGEVLLQVSAGVAHL